jgi:hypothetical protein
MSSLSDMAGKKAAGKLRAALEGGDDAAILSAMKTLVGCCMDEAE